MVVTSCKRSDIWEVKKGEWDLGEHCSLNNQHIDTVSTTIHLIAK